VGRALKRVRVAVKNPLIEALSWLAAARLARRVVGWDELAALEPRRILVIRSDRIGDLLCGTPLIAALHKRWPEARLSLVGGPKNRAVMPLLPYLERAGVEFERHPVSWGRLRAWLPRQGFDIAVSLRSEVFSGALLAAWSRAPVRVAVNAMRTLPAFNTLLAPHDHHQVRRSWTAARALGVTWPEIRPVIEIPPAAVVRAGEVFAALGGGEGRPVIGVGVPNRTDGKHRVKAWPPARLLDFVRLLDATGARVLLFGVGREREEAAAIVAAVPGARLAPSMPLAQVAALQGWLDCFVASYTGTLHLADGAGTRTVAIGSTFNAHNWRPLGPRHRQVSAPIVPEIPIEVVLGAVRELLPGRLAATGAGVPGVGAGG
jgi:heptosyltransferase-3